MGPRMGQLAPWRRRGRLGTAPAGRLCRSHRRRSERLDLRGRAQSDRALDRARAAAVSAERGAGAPDRDRQPHGLCQRRACRRECRRATVLHRRTRGTPDPRFAGPPCRCPRHSGRQQRGRDRRQGGRATKAPRGGQAGRPLHRTRKGRAGAQALRARQRGTGEPGHPESPARSAARTAKEGRHAKGKARRRRRAEGEAEVGRRRAECQAKAEARRWRCAESKAEVGRRRAECQAKAEAR